MDCSLSLCSPIPIQFHTHRFSSPTNSFFFKSLSANPIHLQKSFFYSHSKFLPKHYPIQSTSLPFRIQCSTNPHENNIFKLTVEKLAVMLVAGSLLFMGSLGCKPVLATAQKTSSTVSKEEKIDTQQGKRGDDEEEMYVRLLERNPRDVEALKVVVNSKMRNGKIKEAVEYVERLIDIEPDEVEWRLLQALSFEMMGNLSKAKRLFKEILLERPLLLRALHGLAMVMHKNLDPNVFEMLNKALELAHREKRVTEERNIRILIAQVHVVKGNLEEGLKKFQDLVNDNPRDFRPYLCQGIIYSLLDKKMEAEEQFEIYRSLVPNEFPQRGFLDDVVMEAKTESRERLKKEFAAEFSSRKMRTT